MSSENEKIGAYLAAEAPRKPTNKDIMTNTKQYSHLLLEGPASAPAPRVTSKYPESDTSILRSIGYTADAVPRLELALLRLPAQLK